MLLLPFLPYFPMVPLPNFISSLILLLPLSLTSFFSSLHLS